MDYQESGVFSGRSGHRWSHSGVDIKKVKTKPTPNLATLGRDLLKLLDLQLQMASLDMKQFLTDARMSLFLMIFGAVFALGAVPVMLMGLATSLAEWLEQPVAWVQSGLGAIALVFSLIVIKLSVMGLSRSAQALKRSQEELHNNIEWARNILHREEDE